MSDRVAGPTAEALTALQERLGYVFRDPELLNLALTHASAAPRRKGGGMENGRLEFLGDRVLGMCLSALLYRRYPESEQGDLALRFAALTRREACARVARSANLGACLFLDRGEEKSGGRRRETILADSCEALMAAVFLDGGPASADAVVRHLWMPLVDDGVIQRDAKTLLQEWLLKRGRGIPSYRIVETRGPGHAPHFVVQVTAGEEDQAEGGGLSRRDAEQEAARTLLDRLEGGEE